MATVVFVGYSLLHSLLLIGALLLSWRSPGWDTAILAFVAIGLVYDNAIVAAGRWIGEGDRLAGLAKWRYLLHIFGSPLLIIAGWQVARRAGFAWAATPTALGIAIALTASLIGIDLWTRYRGLELAPVNFGGTLRYKDVRFNPEIPVILTTLILLGLGILFDRQRQWPWLEAGAIAMLVTGAIPIRLVGVLASNGGEVLFCASLLLSVWHFSHG